MTDGVFDVLLEKLRQADLDIVRGFLSVLAMTIAHTEVVAEVAAAEIGTQDEAVLVHFVGVVWYEAYSRREGVLGYHVPLNELGFRQRRFRE